MFGVTPVILVMSRWRSFAAAITPLCSVFASTM